MGKRKNLILALVALIVVAGALAGIYFATKPKTQEGGKHITVQINSKESERTVELAADAEYLGAALTEENLIQGDQGEYGLYVKTVDGYTADESAQEWWCFTKGGQDLFTGVDATPIADGDAFEITLKTGW